MRKKIFFIWVVLIGLFNTIHADAQTKPGNTTYEVELWLTADSAQTTLPADNAYLTGWLDKSGLARNFGQNGTDSLPYFSYSGMNYHPTANFRLAGSSTNNRYRKLVSNDFFPVSQSKSYYLFFVSELNDDASDSNAAVFSFSDGSSTDKTNDNGWRNSSTATNALYHRVRGTDVAPTAFVAAKRAGVASIMKPNVTTSGVYPRFYMNGKLGTNSSGNRQMNDITNSKAIIGNSNLTNGRYFYGTISEVIVLSTTGGNQIDATELRKVHSYLAIKYGITMVGDEVSLYNSSGAMVWDGTASGSNTGFLQNVFGVARDDASGLYQKQAISYNDSRVSVFLGNQMTTLNAQNTGSLDDETYLLFGSNGQSGITSYAYGDETFLNGEMDVPANVRSVLQLKSKLVSQSMTPVTLNVLLQDEENIGYTYLLVSSTSDFLPGNTRIYPVQDGIATDVEVGNDEYLTWVADGGNGPGGVAAGLRLWLNAANQNSLTINASNQVTKWVDPVRNIDYSYMALNSNNRAPTYSDISEQMNYHSAVAFAADPSSGDPSWGAYLSTNNGPMSVATPDYHTMITVINNNFTNAVRTYFMSFGSTTEGVSARNPTYGIEKSGVAGVGRYRHSSEINGTQSLFNAGATTIAFYEAKSATGSSNPGYIRFEFDGNGETSSTYTSADSWSMNGPGILGTGSDNRFMNGVMSEVFLYERPLTADEKVKIYSYLALKYGITLRLTGNATYPNNRYDYQFSNGTAIWQGETDALHGKYYNNVTAIIRDDAAELNNMQARSTDTGAIVRMGVGRKMGTSPDLDGFENDREAIAWGNNGLAGTTAVSESDDICREISTRLNRIWMVDKTTIKNYNVLISATGANNSDMYGATYEVYMLVADSEDDIMNNSVKEVIPGQFIDGEWQFNYTFKNDLTFFTFGGVNRGGACDDCDFEGYRNISFDKTSWPSGNRTGIFNFDGVSANVEITGGTFNSGYPRATTYGSLELSRRDNATDQIITKITLDTPVIPTFEIFDVDRSSNLYDQVQVYGICSGATIAARLSYTTSPSLSVYEINSNVAAASKPTSVSYTDLTGRVNVTFDYPVTEVYIVYTLKGGSSGTQNIGIGAITIECPLSNPVINEDGLSFAKLASSYSVSLCDEVTYTFRIQNVNCDPKKVKFADLLPDGMFWVSNSLALDELNDSDPDIQISSYGGNANLEIDSLTVPGGSTLVFRVKAAFVETAEAQDYENQAFIYYEGVSDDVEWPSTDIRVLDDLTIISAYGDASDREASVEVTYSRSRNNYREEDEVTIILTVDNPNGAITSTRLDIGYDAGFTYVANSFGSSIASVTPVFDSAGSLFYIDEFTLPAGESTFEFTLKAPVTLIPEVDEDGTVIVDSKGNPVIMSLEVDYSFTTSLADMCKVSTLLDANGKVIVPYGSGRGAIISNKHISGKIIKNN